MSTAGTRTVAVASSKPETRGGSESKGRAGPFGSALIGICEGRRRARSVFEGRVGVVEQGTQNDAPLRDLLHRRPRRLLRVGDAQSLFEAVAEPAHRLVAHRAAGPLHRVNVTVEGPRGFDGVVAGRQRAVDAGETVGDLGRVLRARQRIEGASDEIVGRHRPARRHGGLAQTQALDGRSHRRGGLCRRRPRRPRECAG